MWQEMRMLALFYLSVSYRGLLYDRRIRMQALKNPRIKEKGKLNKWVK
jgi:hypothetical protein